MEEEKLREEGERKEEKEDEKMEWEEGRKKDII